MVVRTSRRLPGFRFEVQSPPLTDVLPRMDVAIFVGFAASGPLHRPVAVEDVAQFTSIFGDDVPLAWDQQRSEVVYAYLAPAVRAFFRNGGRRCWVVRVASENAQYNYFPIPGLVQVSSGGQLTPAFARARSEGSWSDTWQVSSALLSLPISLAQISFDNLFVDLVLASPNDIVVGDLLRLTFFDEGYVLMFVVQSIQPIDTQLISSPPQNRAGHSPVRVTGSSGSALWFSTQPTASPLPAATQVVMFTHEGVSSSTTVSDYTISQEGRSQVITLEIPGLSLANAPALGSLIRVDFVAAPSLFLAVKDVSITNKDGSPPTETLQVTGQGLWVLQGSPKPLPASLPEAERLNFELWARQENGYPVRLSDLAFAETHPRFWGTLPTDEQLFYVTDAAGDTSPTFLWQAADDPVHTDLWHEVATPRFPLAGSGTTDTSSQAAFSIPMAMAIVPEQYLGTDTQADTLLDTALKRDGLEIFDASLFLDCDLVEPLTSDVLAQADFLRYQGPFPRSLTGIHAALGVEEATIIAVPDAVHRGWSPAMPGDPIPPQDSSPLIRPEWWHFLDCDPPPTLPAVQAPQRGHFLNCDILVIPPPTLYKIKSPDERGTFTLSWSTYSDPNVRYILEESTSPTFSGSVIIYTGRADQITIYGRSQGDYYYRLRAEVSSNSSDWSNGVVVRVAPANRWKLNDIANYSADILLAVQRAMLRMCAARGDMCAVLGLPEHYHEDDALTHVTRLTAPLGPPIQVCGVDSNVRIVAPLGFGETRAFSYGALYHPWLIGSEENQPNDLRRAPPEGAIAGIWAQRAITRGAWIAPANELLTSVVMLTPPIARARWLDLQEAQINVIRQEPRGFLSLSADTLSTDEDADLRPINVRRLLILLRRLALRLGAIYVFEPNSDAFRRSVQRGFEAMLDQMFVRGAFAGSTPGTSYQVVTDSTLNTPQSVDLGRFIVELRVAPSLPLTFLSIRLVQTGANVSITEGR